jgi:hypothetical protein
MLPNDLEIVSGDALYRVFSVFSPKGGFALLFHEMLVESLERRTAEAAA